MYYDNNKIEEWIILKKILYVKLTDGRMIPRKILKKPLFEIECNECHTKHKLNYYSELRSRYYKCFSCHGKTKFLGKCHTIESIERMKRTKMGMYDGKKNPFYGKHHSENTKKTLSGIMSKKYGGENSPFYGRHHTEENKKISALRQKEWWENLNEEEKNKIRKKQSNFQQQLMLEDREKYSENKRKAARQSCLSIKRYAKNKIEEIVESKLNEMGMYPKYSTILGYNQYDFGFKNERILLEVQGDYWHSNPKFYDGKTLNKTQQKVKVRDNIKKKFADDNNFILFYIWEDDINNNNFEILEKIKNEIQIYRTKINKLHFDIKIPVYDISVEQDESYTIGKNKTIVHNCRTRQFTGFGSSTVTSLVECVNAAKNIKIMSDGGLTVDNNGEVWIGDINKALVLGADYIMSGAAFSKCLDSPSIINGYYGNASEQAKGHKKHIEGTNVKIETNGLTISQMCDLIGDSIKSGISYAGGKDLKAFDSVIWEKL